MNSRVHHPHNQGSLSLPFLHSRFLPFQRPPAPQLPFTQQTPIRDHHPPFLPSLGQTPKERKKQNKTTTVCSLPLSLSTAYSQLLTNAAFLPSSCPLSASSFSINLAISNFLASCLLCSTISLTLFVLLTITNTPSQSKVRTS
ncbi:hypothetical protein CDL15_Pgr022337 [Punica granatum]|uniref:Uncharacterized protein n=1 Tax=Punica granatum TaxID=22663 RepID=A0A218Y3E9_PUNGR|nr:hypothetical protein CDL15_Pgr022337 [Punica granatum]